VALLLDTSYEVASYPVDDLTHSHCWFALASTHFSKRAWAPAVFSAMERQRSLFGRSPW
jgi:hypothetical protein